ncbi:MULTISPECIES: RHS repeat-associated core domain-containing protein [Amycolatopsis]|uniref:RHS repeat-associated core domain-containing protein n=1 Tax=Amycolatopsis dongchuanensis TaxID=1070866 RepID=A0ABP8VDI1_9PSEU|nr:RHS repeat-associated core domain-containing protein [Amycolatopsis sacchari]
MSNPLVAQEQSSTKAYSGVSILETAFDLDNAIKSGDWAAVALGAVGTALDALSMAMDPFGAILAAGVGWLMEHVGPLKEALDALAGNPDKITAHSETWANVAKELGDIQTELKNAVDADLQSWTGPAADSYRARAADTGNLLEAAEKGADGASSGIKTAGEVVAAVRSLVRDIIAELIGHLISWALQVLFTLGIASAWVVPQVVAAVAKVASKIADLTKRVVKALQALGKLLKQASEMFGNAGKAFRNLKPGSKTTPGKPSDLGGTSKSGATTPSSTTDSAPPPGGKGGSSEGTGSGSKGDTDATDTSSASNGNGNTTRGNPGSNGNTNPAGTGKNGDNSKSLSENNQNLNENKKPVEKRPDCGDPIDVATGWMMLTQTDLRVDGALPLEFSRAHISSYRAGRFFGPSWASTVDQRLEVAEDGLHVALADGSIQRYPVPMGSPVLPDGGPARPLRAVEDGYLVEHPDEQRTLFFEASPDGVHPLRTIIDGDGNRIDILPGADGVPAELVHSSGTRLLLDNENGLITALRTPEGTVLASYTYDERARLTRIVNDTGTPTWFTYDAEGRIVRWEDVNGRWYTYQFNGEGRVVRAAGTDGYLDCTLDYDRENLVTTVTDSLGAVRRYQLDTRLNVIAETDPLGNTTTFSYDRHDRLLTRTDPLGGRTRYERNEAGRVVAVTAPDGTRTLTEYNELGRPSALITPDGATWRYSYDERGKLVAVVDPLGARTTYAYDERGNVAVITDPLGGVRRIESDAAGRPLVVTDENGAVTRYTYDSLGRPTSMTDELGGVTRYSWATPDELAELVGPDGAALRWRSTPVGNVEESIDALGNASRVEFAHFDLPVAETGPNGERVTYTYDTELRLVAMTNEQGFVWRYHYDPAGNLISETDFNGRTLRYRYDAAGRLVESTNGAGETTVLERDAMGRVVRRVTGNDVTTFTYDVAGKMVAARNADAEVTFTHDAVGRVVAETINGRPVRSAYDALGRRIARHTPSGAESRFEYDPTGSLTALHTGGRTIRFERDLAGRERVRRFAGTELRQAWSPAGELTAQTVVAGSRTLQRREYAYLADGYLRSVFDAISGPRTLDVDRTGRVRAVTGPGWQENYAYHLSGVISHAQTPGEPGPAPREYRGTLLASAGRLRFAYDPEGRATRRGAGPDGPHWQFGWNADSRLTFVVTPNGERWRYRYDALGRRVAKQRLARDGRVAKQVLFAWDGDTLAEQVHSGPGRPQVATVWEWDPDTGRALTQTERVLGTTDERFHAIITDLVGTPTELLDESGAVAWHLRATLWGKVVSAPGRATTPLRFPGQYFDAETGLHYNVHRYYDPEVGRYLSHDPLGLDPGPDSQAYVLNPTALVDPLGLMPKAATTTPCKKAQARPSPYGNAKQKVKNAVQKINPFGTKKPRGNPDKSDGTYGKTQNEQARTWQKFQNDIKNDPDWKDPDGLVSGKTHESEHPIGYKAIGGDDFQRANAHAQQIKKDKDAGKRPNDATPAEKANMKHARRLEDNAPAYQESYDSHRANIGTGTKTDRDGSNMNADEYRESQRNLLAGNNAPGHNTPGNAGDAVQLNQLTYAHQHYKPEMVDNPSYKADGSTPNEPEKLYARDSQDPDKLKEVPTSDSFRPTKGTTQGNVADDSYHHMVDNMVGKKIEFSDGQGGFRFTPEITKDDALGMHTARDMVRDGPIPKDQMEKYLNDKRDTYLDRELGRTFDDKPTPIQDPDAKDAAAKMREHQERLIAEQRATRDWMDLD